MRRRDFIKLCGGIAAATPATLWSRVARAQQPMPVIGFLGAVSPDGLTERLRGFRQGLKDSGYVEGENSRSSTAGPITGSTCCRGWRPIWFASGSR